MHQETILLTLMAMAAVACNLESTEGDRGGVEFNGGAGAEGRGREDSAGMAGMAGTAGSDGHAGEENPDPAPCERGLVIVDLDYVSSNVAIAELDGTILSESFVSSGSARPGLSLALSGDVDVPRVAPTSGRVVLLDRYGTNVITFLDPGTAKVLGQLPVGTGFESNPQDYLEYDATGAVVSRFGTNTDPGHASYDEGGDLLLIDTKAFEITGRIPMPEEEPELLPRPGGMTMLGDTVVVTLGRLSADYDKAGNGRFVGVSPKDKAVLWTVNMEDVSNCGRLALSPSRAVGAVACSSRFDSTTYAYNPQESDIVVFDVTVTPPKEIRRLGLGVSLDAGLQPTVEFVSETMLLALAYGGNSTVGDRALAVDIQTGDSEVLVETETPYMLPSIHCAPGCGDVCVIADAEAGLLHRFSVSQKGRFERLPDVVTDTTVGLPPQRIGAL